MNIAVVGTGAWGTAIARYLCNKDENYNVRILARNEEVVYAINDLRENTYYLKKVILPRKLVATKDINEAFEEVDIIVIAIPSQGVRDFLIKNKNKWEQTAKVIILTKGLEERTGKRMTQVIDDILKLPKDQVAILSGPNIAECFADDFDAATVIASECEETAIYFQEIFSSKTFYVETSTDVIGVELGGAIKNVVAIAAGMCDALNRGVNYKAAVITKGINEISEFGKTLGADQATFTGLSCIGDVLVTAEKGRNYKYGKEFVQGGVSKRIHNEYSSVIEGVHTVCGLHVLAPIEGTLPICDAVYKVLKDNYAAKEVFNLKYIF
jgi:glycerol-3-phosphate dehydrogenase (NAD(P)+)